MGFWIFMVLMNVMVPLLMIGCGKLFLTSPPEDINKFFGYRTKRSMKSQEAWDFAQRYFARIWWKLGLGMLPCSVVFMLPVMKKGINAVGIWGSVVMCLECAVMIGSMIPVERALKKLFG